MKFQRKQNNQEQICFLFIKRTYYHTLYLAVNFIHLLLECVTSFLLSVSVKFITVTRSLLFLARHSAYKIAAPLENAVRAVAIARNNICVAYMMYIEERGT